MQRSILIVEDEREIADLVALHLRDQGWTIRAVADGARARTALAEQRYDLVILDLMLPDGDGLEVCRWLRGRADYTPVLMLTARSSEVDRVVGLELGADDYLTKPFSVRELLARVKALFRRVEALRAEVRHPDEGEIRAGDLEIDPKRRRVRVGGREAELTAREFDLLHHLARQPGRVYTRAQLLEQVWGYGHEGYAHTVNSHINRLRAKIEADPARPRHVLTVWGVGYKFADDENGGAG